MPTIICKINVDRNTYVVSGAATDINYSGTSGSGFRFTVEDKIRGIYIYMIA